MKAKFEIKSFLTANREQVIAMYNKVALDPHFNPNVTLHNFMGHVLNAMIFNKCASEKRASYILPTVLGFVFMDSLIKR